MKIVTYILLAIVCLWGSLAIGYAVSHPDLSAHDFIKHNFNGTLHNWTMSLINFGPNPGN